MERAHRRTLICSVFCGRTTIVLGLIYLLFTFGGQSKQHWNVLIADPGGILKNKIMASEDKSISYSFADGYIEVKEFAKAKQFQPYDALLEVNEKVLSNKSGFVFYRERPSVRMQTKLQYHIERRLEEVMIEQFTTVSLTEY